MYEMINDDMKYTVKEGDMIKIYESNWNYSKRIGKPYNAIVLWCGNNNQPLVTKTDEYRPHWITYEDIVEIVGYVDLKNLFNRIYPDLMKSKEIKKVR